MNISLIKARENLQLDEAESGSVFQIKDVDGYYMATDEYEGDRRLVVDIEDGIITREKKELIVIVRDDLIIAQK